MSTTSMFFDIFGRDKGVGAMFDKVSGKGKDTSNMLQGLGAAAAGMGIVKAGTDAVDKFKDVAGAALLLQRETGASAEESSRLGFALTQAGMSAEDTKKGFGIFSKNLVASEKDATTHAAMVGKLGMEYTDAQGKLLPMTEILPKLATKFQDMENGPEKTALAMQLFGKSGADMIPFLNKGGDAIGELMHKSDELGTTMDQGAINSFKDAKKESREWEATITGLQVTIGGALLPVLTSLQTLVHNQLGPAITGAVGWFKSLSPEMQQVVAVIGGLLLVGGPLVLVIGKFASAFTQITGAVKSFKEVMTALNVVLAANPFILIILGIALLVAGLVWAYNNVGWFKDFVDSAFKVVQAVVSAVFGYISGTIVPNFQRSIGAIGHAIDDGVSWFNGFKDNVSRAIDGAIRFVEDIPGKVTGALRGAGDWLSQTGRDIIGGLIGGIQETIGGISKTITDGVNGAIDTVKNVLGIHSPSTVMAEQVGAPMGQGVIGGVRSTFSGIKNAVAGIKDIVKGTDFGVNVDGSLSVAGGAAVQSIRSQQSTQTVNVTAYFTNPFTGEQIKQTVQAVVDDSITAAGDDAALRRRGPS